MAATINQNIAAEEANSNAATADENESHDSDDDHVRFKKNGDSNDLRKASFTEPEAFVLKSLLVDDEHPTSSNDANKDAERSLSAEMLATVPASMLQQSEATQQTRDPPKRISILGLWRAHADGVHPRALVKRASQHEAEPTKEQVAVSSPDNVDDGESYPSDVEVTEGLEETDSLSWDSKDDQNHHLYDAWEVLKDEYSPDYGFNYTSPSEDLSDDTIPSGFQILGTSADDTSAQPHVLSPPLLDSLMNFLPDSIIGENYWLRFSLVRDGASIETLKHYIRAAENTILAIETPDGQVFGAFCSTPWKNHHGFFGTPPAFVWRMRYSRRTKSASLFEQAKLESEIDVFMASPDDPEKPIQVCRHDLLGVGGDDSSSEDLALNSRAGFALCIDEFLAEGTTSYSATFHNPSLCGSGEKPQTFEIANLEVWSLTPCLDVYTAERLEMRKYFVEHGSTDSISSSSIGNRRHKSSLSSSDFSQDAFFRRVGHDQESEIRRERWQYMNMMNPDLDPSKSRGLGSSPRYT